MSQLALFDRATRTLVDDTSGTIRYHPAAVDQSTAQSWFEALRDGVAWKSERRLMYEREVDVPRLVASFRLAELRAARASDVRTAIHDVLLAAAECAEPIAGARFDSVGLNFYRDGRDSVAPHNDHLDEIAPGAPIALLSLGSTRRMTIRAKQKPPRVLHLELEPGSVLTMSYETQRHYDHGIPKTAEGVGPRISLAFRVRLQQGAARY